MLAKQTNRFANIIKHFFFKHHYFSYIVFEKKERFIIFSICNTSFYYYYWIDVVLFVFKYFYDLKKKCTIFTKEMQNVRDISFIHKYANFSTHLPLYYTTRNTDFINNTTRVKKARKKLNSFFFIFVLSQKSLIWYACKTIPIFNLWWFKK